MDLGLYLSQPSDAAALERLVAVVEAADARGFRTVWIGDHVVLFDEVASRYPYAQDGRSPFAGDMNWLGPFELLTYLAARTSRVRLGTGIVLVPQRNPLYTAKSVSTLDFLSAGRLDFGIGMGWTREEYEALGVPFEGRGKRGDEYVALMKRLWTEDVASFSGETYELPPSKQRPFPVQKPHPPIFVGGESDAALRRVARLGDGWFGLGLSAEQAAERVERLKALLADSGRDIADVSIAIGMGGPDTTLDDAKAYADAGVSQYVVRVPGTGSLEDDVAQMDRYAETLLAPLAG
jgi:probable F420-dependent oxidoreductase